jgi:uncharacterized protein (TIGR03663 family)
MNCPKCGAENPASNRFCDECGTKLAAASPTPAAKKETKKPQPAPVSPAPAASVVTAPGMPSGSAMEWIVKWMTLENLVWALLLIAGVWLRFYALGDKPLHHDESLHAFYSWNYFKGNGYAYDPMMHGPLQFHGNALMYFLFGASDFTARIMAASCSVFCLVLIYGLRPFLGRAGAMFTGVMMLLSPSFTYFGRFTREDIYFVTFTFVMLYGMFHYLRSRQPRHLYYVGIGIALAFCTKEVIYIVGYIFFFTLVFRWLWEKSTDQPGENQITDLLKEFRTNPKTLYVTLAIFGAIMLVLYTSFFSNPRGIIDAFTKSWSYWLGQHEVQRGSQPMYYYAALMPFYEPLAFFGTLAAILYYSFIMDKTNRGWRLLGYVVVIAAWWLFAIEGKQSAGLVFSLLLITLGTGLVGYFSYGKQSMWVVVLLVWTVAGFSDLSFAGERMPWLIVHPLLPMILLTGTFLNDLWERFQKQRKWLVAVVALFSVLLLHNTVNLCFYENGANPAEQLVYVQSSTDVPQVVRQITSMSKRLNGNLEMKITCEDYCSWPFAWYLRDFKYVGYPKFTANQAEGSIEKTPLIITGVEMATPGHDERVAQLLAADYVAQRYKLRVWWAPDPNVIFDDTMGGQLQKIWRLFIYREPWNGLGSYDMIVYVRKDVAYLYWGNAK